MSVIENSSSVKVTTSVLGVISLPSFNITLNGMDAGIMDGWGDFYLLFAQTCLGSRVLIEEDICQAGRAVDLRHLDVQHQVR